mmetsp:Transcript_11160/g.29040  ORF Transcript_11160/g.29040 Transcript_11160/m.29040 type:complete len:256 (+) Transcript_11160:382-1149(+)
MCCGAVAQWPRAARSNTWRSSPRGWRSCGSTISCTGISSRTTCYSSLRTRWVRTARPRSKGSRPHLCLCSRSLTLASRARSCRTTWRRRCAARPSTWRPRSCATRSTTPRRTSGLSARFYSSCSLDARPSRVPTTSSCCSTLRRASRRFRLCAWATCRARRSAQRCCAGCSGATRSSASRSMSSSRTRSCAHATGTTALRSMHRRRTRSRHWHRQQRIPGRLRLRLRTPPAPPPMHRRSSRSCRRTRCTRRPRRS